MDGQLLFKGRGLHVRPTSYWRRQDVDASASVEGARGELRPPSSDANYFAAILHTKNKHVELLR